jgi:N-methylhydantoinase A/oxoprolinase/acetone carboxylase beta subunit
MIAENLREAIDLWLKQVRENSYGVNIITPYGELISDEGIISGGANINYAEKLIPELSEKLKNERETYFEESNGFVKTRVYDGDQLLYGNILEGPSIVEEKMTNILIPPQRQTAKASHPGIC